MNEAPASSSNDSSREAAWSKKHTIARQIIQLRGKCLGSRAYLTVPKAIRVTNYTNEWSALNLPSDSHSRQRKYRFVEKADGWIEERFGNGNTKHSIDECPLPPSSFPFEEVQKAFVHVNIATVNHWLIGNQRPRGIKTHKTDAHSPNWWIENSAGTNQSTLKLASFET